MIPIKIIKLWLYKDELYSKIVTFGYLTYYNGKISIPNKELEKKFIHVL